MPKDTTKLLPLHVQLQKDQEVVPRQRVKKEKARPVENIVDPKQTKKILRMAKEQQDEIEGTQVQEVDLGRVKSSFSKSRGVSDDDESNMDEEEFEDWDGEEILDIDERDQELVEKFMNPAEKQKLNLSEIILQKINLGNAPQPAGSDEMNPKVIEVYTKVGLLLSRYKSGPMPKTFKILPTLRDWERVLYITNPHDWTPQATYQATRIFTSNLKSKMAQRYFNLILLPRVRDDIHENKKLNYHLYMSIKKSLYKPAAFFKGFLLPLLEDQCTLREAAIIGSVLVKVSVPVLHSAAALLKVAEMEYSGPASLFIRVLLDKKYALPYKVIDSLVFHFLQFMNDDREMPVLWHQSFLVFAQRYKEDMTHEQKEELLKLLKVKIHHQITPEIRKELQNSVCRGEEKPAEDIEML